MKTTNIFILTFLAATLTLVSCEKNRTKPEPTHQKDIVRTITTDSYTAEFIYDEDTTLSRIDMQYHMAGNSSTGTVNFIWSNDRLDIENSSEGYTLKYSFTIENGRAAAMFSNERETPTATFEYDTEGHLSHITWTDEYKDTFTWKNGNMTAVSGTMDAEIGYGDIVNNTNLDFIHIISPGCLSQISYPYSSLIGLLGTSSANLPESESCYIDGYEALKITYSYNLDEDGRITAVDINSGGHKSTVKIGY